MYPVLYSNDYFEITTYSVMAIFAAILGAVFVFTRAKKYGYTLYYTYMAGFYAIIGLLFGAKILYMFTVLPQFITNITNNPYAYPTLYDSFMFLFGGLVFYGGLLGACLGLFIYVKLHPLGNDFNRLLELYTPVAPLVHAIGRIGCFMAGCCYGISCDCAVCVRFNFNKYVPELSDTPRFPVQLVESAYNFIIFIIILLYQRKLRKNDNKALLSSAELYLILYPVVRFILEFFRGDTIRGVWGVLFTSQIISLLIVVFVAVRLILKFAKSKNTA